MAAAWGRCTAPWPSCRRGRGGLSSWLRKACFWPFSVLLPWFSIGFSWFSGAPDVFSSGFNEELQAQKALKLFALMATSRRVTHPYVYLTGEATASPLEDVCRHGRVDSTAISGWTAVK